MAGASAVVKISNAIAMLGSYPNNLVIIVLAGALFYLFFYKTKYGWQIKAIGNNEKLCKNVGLNTAKLKTISYMVSAVMCGFAAILSICYSGTISTPTQSSTLSMVFKPIMGALIGMQLVRFWDNLPVLIFVGELCIQIIFNGLIALGLNDAWQNVMLGGFIILVMYITGDGTDLIPEIRRAKNLKKYRANM